VRVAVQLGADAVRVAGAGADSEPWLVARLPPAETPETPVGGAAAELAGPDVEELVLVHPGRWQPAEVAAWAAGSAGAAACVRAVPAPLAAAGGPGPVVLDVGISGAECAWVGPDGAVGAWCAVDVGGRRLDGLVAARFAVGQAEARRVREALSLLPSVHAHLPGGAGRVTAVELRAVLAPALGEVVDAVREVLAVAGPAPVLLVGGVARTPLLAELLDEAGIPDVTVAPRPAAAAALGALTLPPDAGVVAGSRRIDAQAVAAAPARLLGPPVRRPSRPVRTAASALLGAAAVGALLAAGQLVAPGPAPAQAVTGVLVQYGYRLDLPAGWEHTGGLPVRRRVLLTPVSAPEGSDLVAVERTPLGYDSGAEPDRAAAELRAEFAAAVAAGSPLSGYDPDAEVAGRRGTAYRQEEADGTVVEWFVVLDGDAQLSVGCRSTRANAGAVRAACDRVVASVRRA
jgi:type VII secretion-associated protein (TIGR03931 family)